MNKIKILKGIMNTEVLLIAIICIIIILVFKIPIPTVFLEPVNSQIDLKNVLLIILLIILIILIITSVICYIIYQKIKKQEEILDGNSKN